MRKRFDRIPLIAAFAGMALLAVAQPAMAGKPERDRADELKPQVSELVTAVKSACGCDVTVAVDWDSYASVDSMLRIPDTLTAFKEATAAFCDKPVDKELFCKHIAGLKVRFNSEAAPVLESKQIATGSDDSTYAGTESFAEILNKL